MGVLCIRAEHSLMMNVKGDEAKRVEIRKAQAKLAHWVSFMPDSCICPFCGFDFIEHPEVFVKPITGCPTCHRSYCE
tara:strand:- start:245 stop:475 length:231 start_codon:yes stop_codon:yes gene_type:complete